MDKREPNAPILYPWTITRGNKLPPPPCGWEDSVQFTHICRCREYAERSAKSQASYFYDDFTLRAVPIPSTGKR